jgi:hypothetical protein
MFYVFWEAAMPARPTIHGWRQWKWLAEPPTAMYPSFAAVRFGVFVVV